MTAEEKKAFLLAVQAQMESSHDFCLAFVADQDPDTLAIIARDLCIRILKLTNILVPSAVDGKVTGPKRELTDLVLYSFALRGFEATISEEMLINQAEEGGKIQ